jgi:ADP-heptose:LPS heptosyltransferase
VKHEHILIIRFSALGDVAMTVPVVYSLAHQYPDVRITVLSKAFARPFFENIAPNVGFMEADVKNEYHGVKGLNALYRRLTAKKFTAIADLHNVLRS